jgi:opacity protein-like surface antigen
MKKFLFACSAVAMLSSAVVASDYTSNVNVYGGYNIADSDCVIDDAPVFGLNYHTFFNDNVGARLSYERVVDADFNNGATTLSGNGTSTSVNRFALNGVLKKAKAWHKITPYILAGGGYENYEDGVRAANGGSCSGQWFLDAGVGAAIALTDRLSINPEVRALRKDKCETIDIVPTIGLAYAFGGAKTRVVEKVVVKEVPVEKVVTITAPAKVVDVCPVPTNYTDRCDNTYYVQVASELKCTDCDEKIKNMALIHKLDAHGYTHRNFVSTNPSGTQVNRLLVGPYRCKKDAFEALCEIKKTIQCDAFVYSTKK